MDNDEPTITVCRDVAGDHIGGPECWCRSVTMTLSEWDKYIQERPEDWKCTLVGLDS